MQLLPSRGLRSADGATHLPAGCARGKRRAAAGALLAVTALLSASCSGSAADSAAAGTGPGQSAPGAPVAATVASGMEQRAPSAPAQVRAVRVASGLDELRSLSFSPDGQRILLARKDGELRVLGIDGRLSGPVQGVPRVFTEDQAGLLDVVPGPGFDRDGSVYLSYVEPIETGEVRVAVARARLSGETLSDLQIVFRQQPALHSTAQFAGRLQFDATEHLFVSLGDLRHEALVQSLDNTVGKIVRLKPDGSIPLDNPFVNTPGALPEIWTLGHRNPQGLAIDPATGVLYEGEHGPRGGDELNHIQKGRNYGWPRITSGHDYETDGPVGEAVNAVGFESPLLDFARTTIAPSGIAIYRGKALAGWDGAMLVSGLRSRQLLRVDMADSTPGATHSLLRDLDERVRDVKVAPGTGLPWVVTDAGNVYRLEPR